MAINPKVSLAAGIVFISFYPIFIKLADEPAITAAFYRIFIGLVLLTPYCVSKGLLKINRNDLLVALLAGMVFAADIACWNISILKISATISTVLANLAPVWVGLISLLVLKKPSGWLFWVGTLIAIIGMVILVGYDNILHLQISIGVAMAVLCSVFYGIYILLTKGILQRVNTITFMFYSMLAAATGLFAAMQFQGAEMLHFKTSSWLYFAGMGIICQLLGWLTINYAIKHLPPTRVSVTLLSQNVTTGLLAVWLLNEKLGLTEIIGSVIILMGIAITFLKPSQSNNL